MKSLWRPLSPLESEVDETFSVCFELWVCGGKHVFGKPSERTQSVSPGAASGPQQTGNGEKKKNIWIKPVSFIWTFPASGNVGRYRLVWFCTYHRPVSVKSPPKTALIGVSIVNLHLVETITWEEICRKCCLHETLTEVATVVLLHDGVHFIHSVLQGSFSFVYYSLFAVVIDTTHFCL